MTLLAATALRARVPESAIVANSANDNTPTGASLYARYAFAGAMCCSITHGALTPGTFILTSVDVVKTRIQLEPTVYNRGMIQAFKQVVQAEGASALLTGFGPTAAGYFLQGALKFGGYEFWKKQFIELVGKENASDYRTPIYLCSSALAEVAADVALCPLEATRIRLVSQPTFANGLIGGFSRLWREEGVLRGFYSGFGPILFKQVPYTMAKFAVYELTAEKMYEAIGTAKEKLSNSTVTAVDLGAGMIAGAAAAVISQPADTLLSKMNKTKAAVGETIVSRLLAFSKALGPRGLFLGLGARVIMVGTLTAGQFAINGEVKRKLGATGGYDIKKKQ